MLDIFPAVGLILYHVVRPEQTLPPGRHHTRLSPDVRHVSALVDADWPEHYQSLCGIGRVYLGCDLGQKKQDEDGGAADKSESPQEP